MLNNTETTKNEEELSAFLHADKTELLNVIEQNHVVISQQERRIKILEEGLRLARIKRFSSSSEKTDAQEEMFDEAEQQADEDVSDNIPPVEPKKKAKTGRKPFSKNIPRVPVFIDLTDEEKEGAT